MSLNATTAADPFAGGSGTRVHVHAGNSAAPSASAATATASGVSAARGRFGFRTNRTVEPLASSPDFTPRSSSPAGSRSGGGIGAPAGAT